MKKLLTLLLILCAFPAFAGSPILIAYDSTYHETNKSPTPGDIIGVSDIYYYYDPQSKILTVTQTEWISDGAGDTYPSPRENTYYYHDVTFDNMCDRLAEYCTDNIKQQIQEKKTEYESSVNQPSTEQNANKYTDERINALRKELSAGIASVAAMSSIATSNVTKGEVSIGSGYGYYNGQSAVAIGAAIGLSDKWSANAATGLANSNISFRAGTNYKFRLF